MRFPTEPVEVMPVNEIIATGGPPLGVPMSVEHFDVGWVTTERVADDTPEALALMDDIQFALDAVDSPTSTTSYALARAIVEALLASPEAVLAALGFEKFDEDGMSEQWERRKTARA